jgi:hypothetical protein
MNPDDRAPRRRRSKWWIAVVAATLAVAGSVTLALLLGPPEKPAAPPRGSGCETSDDCPGHAVCAARGCLPLLPAEFRTMWEDDLASQLDPAVPWKPPSFFGEKLLPCEVCPAPAASVPPPDENHLQHLVKTTVFDLGGEGIRIHRQQRVKGTMWFESVRFWLPPGLGGAGAPDALCVSAGVVAALTGRGKWRGRETTYVDLSLPQAVPVGQEARAALTVGFDPLPADEEGRRALELKFDPVFDGAVERTAVALPLGCEVVALEGTPPTRQRLLTGYVAYIWEHGEAPGEATVRFRPSANPGRVLDIRELNP